MQLPYSLRGAVWILIYLLFILAPLFALLAGSHPPARDFWTEFSVALGYSGLAMMGHRALPVRHRAVGRRRHLPFSPSDFADSGRSRRSASGHSSGRSAAIVNAVQYG